MPEPVRYQHSPWHVKLWRMRWYALVPYDFVTMWLSDRMSDDPWGVRFAWDTAVAFAHMRMHWVYTWEELGIDG